MAGVKSELKPAHGVSKPFRVTWAPNEGASVVAERMGLANAIDAALAGVDLKWRGVEKAVSRARVALNYIEAASFPMRDGVGGVAGTLTVERLDDSDAVRLRSEEAARIEANAGSGSGGWGDQRRQHYRARLRVFDTAGDHALSQWGNVAESDSDAFHLIEADGLLALLQRAAQVASEIHAGHGFTAEPECWTQAELARRLPHIRSQLSRDGKTGTSVVVPARGLNYGPTPERQRYRAYIDFGEHIEELHERAAERATPRDIRRKPISET